MYDDPTIEGFKLIWRGIRMLLGTEVPKPHAVALTMVFVQTEPKIRFWPKGTKKMQITDIQTVVATLAAPVSIDGNPTGDIIDAGSVTWQSSNEAVVMVTPSEDGMSAVIGSPDKGPLGMAVVTVRATLNNGQLSVAGTVDVEIKASAAVSLRIDLGQPQ